MSRLTHVIPAAHVDAEERRLAAVLDKAGYDVGRLTLAPLAQQVLAERSKAAVMALGIQPVEAPYLVRSDGGIEVRFAFASETDHVAAMMALS